MAGMSGDARLEKLDRVYGIFHVFQLTALGAGTLAAGLSALLSSDLWGTLYAVILFGQVIAFILFAIITMNLTDTTMKKRYPDVKPEKHLTVTPSGFRCGEDWNSPMREKVRKTQDQLAKSVYQKIGRTWLFCILNVFIPTIALYLAQALCR